VPAQRLHLGGQPRLDPFHGRVAVWDDQPSKDQGGTGALVEQARKLGKQVHVVWPEGAARG